MSELIEIIKKQPALILIVLFALALMAMLAYGSHTSIYGNKNRPLKRYRATINANGEKYIISFSARMSEMAYYDPLNLLRQADVMKEEHGNIYLYPDSGGMIILRNTQPMVCELVEIPEDNDNANNQ